jgi:hypothetical protein
MASPYAFGRENSEGSLLDPEEQPHVPRPPAGRKPRHDSRARTDSESSDDSRLERRLSYLPSTMRRYVKKKEKKGSGHVLERIILCGVAVILLWTTSLLVAKEIVVRVIPRPEVDTVKVKVEAAITLTDTLQKGHKDCADEKLSTCDIAYLKDLKDENDRVEAIRTANYVTLATYG